MAISTIRTTYALDAQTERTLEQIARRWGVSKSEALRRSIRAAARQSFSESVDTLQALTELQESLGLSRRAAQAWLRRAQQQRRASAARQEARGF
jgi:hypothetical protein